MVSTTDLPSWLPSQVMESMLTHFSKILDNELNHRNLHKPSTNTNEESKRFHPVQNSHRRTESEMSAVSIMSDAYSINSNVTEEDADLDDTILGAVTVGK